MQSDYWLRLTVCVRFSGLTTCIRTLWFFHLQCTHAQCVKTSQSVRRPTRRRSNLNRCVLFLFFYYRYYFPRQCRCVAWDPGPFGSVPQASNSQQAMWEKSHQQVRVKSAAGSRPRCLRLCPLSPSLYGRLLIDSQSMSTFFRRRCEVLHCRRDPLSFEMRRWADTEPADPDLLFEVRGPRRAHKPARPLGGFMLLHNALEEMLLTRRKRSCRALHEYLSGWLAVGVYSSPRSFLKSADNLFGVVPLDIWYNDSIIPTIFERCLLQHFAAYSGVIIYKDFPHKFPDLFAFWYLLHEGIPFMEKIFQGYANCVAEEGAEEKNFQGCKSKNYCNENLILPETGCINNVWQMQTTHVKPQHKSHTNTPVLWNL